MSPCARIEGFWSSYYRAPTSARRDDMLSSLSAEDRRAWDNPPKGCLDFGHSRFPHTLVHALREHISCDLLELTLFLRGQLRIASRPVDLSP